MKWYFVGFVSGIVFGVMIAMSYGWSNLAAVCPWLAT